MSSADIYNFIQVDEQISTAGQPTAEQLAAAAREGFKRVINLATLDPRYALDDEAGLVRSLGMDYVHIPVQWDQPTPADFEAFEQAMSAPSPGKTLIHCAANFRVTAFYALYAQRHLGWSEAQAEEFRSAIWKGSHFPVWEQFIVAMRAQSP